eukprot:591369-Rhodomonas_salina.1
MFSQTLATPSAAVRGRKNGGADTNQPGEPPFQNHSSGLSGSLASLSSRVNGSKQAMLSQLAFILTRKIKINLSNHMTGPGHAFTVSIHDPDSGSENQNQLAKS